MSFRVWHQYVQRMVKKVQWEMDVDEQRKRAEMFDKEFIPPEFPEEDKNAPLLKSWLFLCSEFYSIVLCFL